MSIDEFIEKLSEKRGAHWRFAFNGRLRCGEGLDAHCPISALTGDPSDVGNPWKAGKEKLGLNFIDTERLQAAADASPRCDKGLRARLLSAVGLSTQDT